MARTMIRTNSYKHLVTTLLVGISLFPTLCIAQGKSLTLMTWNLEWLTTTPSSKFPSSNRGAEDFRALQNYFNEIRPEVLAFQEVDSIEAIERVVGKHYHIYLSDRSAVHNRQHQFSDINQYTGFAIHYELTVIDTPDFPLTIGDKLRFASSVILEAVNGAPIHLLSVHLKAGCSGKLTKHRSCKKLRQEGQVIHSWLKERERSNDSFIILGDFNHNLSYHEDWLWRDLVSHLNSVPRLASKSTPAICKVRSKRSSTRTHQFRSLIDHIIVSPDLQTGAAVQHAMPISQVLNYQMSDHCPLSVELY